MTINQILNEQMKSFDEKFVNKLAPHGGDGNAWHGEEGVEYWDTLINAEDEGKVEELKSFIHSYTRKLIESVAEEIIGEDETEVGQIARDEKLGVQTYYVITANMKRRNQLRAEQRLKVKEILEVIK